MLRRANENDGTTSSGAASQNCLCPDSTMPSVCSAGGNVEHDNSAFHSWGKCGVSVTMNYCPCLPHPSAPRGVKNTRQPGLLFEPSTLVKRNIDLISFC